RPARGHSPRLSRGAAAAQGAGERESRRGAGRRPLGQAAAPQAMSARRTVVVTGGSRGLGLAAARTLARSGFNVVAVPRSEVAARASARTTVPGSLPFQACDLADIGALPALVRTLRRSFGPIYGLVNNAGIGTAGVLATLADPKIEALVRLNLTSPMVLT